MTKLMALGVHTAETRAHGDSPHLGREGHAQLAGPVAEQALRGQQGLQPQDDPTRK